MAHEIEGNNAFFTGKAAWHGLGTVLTEAPTPEEAWKLAYPHTLHKLDLEAVVKGDDGSIHRMPLTSSKVIIRDDGKEFKTVGANFELVQPLEIFEFFRPMIESGLITLEAGGSLREGSQMWCLGKVKGGEAEVIKGDPIKCYLNFFTGFDGRLQAGFNQTNIRVVCANTLALATGIGGNGRITSAQKKKYGIQTFKHTKNIRLKINDAMAYVKATLDNFTRDIEAFRVLAKKKVSEPKLETYVRRVFLTKDELEEKVEISTKKQNIVSDVIDLLDTQRGLDLVPAIRGTAWQGYNAVTQYLSHDYGRSADTRLTSLWHGQNAALNTNALALALEM